MLLILLSASFSGPFDSVGGRLSVSHFSLTHWFSVLAGLLFFLPLCPSLFTRQTELSIYGSIFLFRKVFDSIRSFQIRLLTTQHSSADTIRLWLERSGNDVPLDIEIFLRVAHAKPKPDIPTLRVRRTTASLTPLTPSWNVSFPSHTLPSHYMFSHPPPAGNAPIVMPPSPTSSQESLSPPFGGHSHERFANPLPPASMHWGHIVFFYLSQQMKRWERFVFRFDKQFTSMGALKAINGTVFGHQFSPCLMIYLQGTRLA